MTKQQSLITAVAALIALNLGMLAYFSFGKSDKPHHRQPKYVVIEKLRFSEGQIADYEVLIQEHRRAVSDLERQMLRQKQELYLTSTSGETELQDSLAQNIGNTIAAIERQHVLHFQKIRELCDPNQLPLYDELVQNLPKIFRPPGPPKKPH